MNFYLLVRSRSALFLILFLLIVYSLLKIFVVNDEILFDPAAIEQDNSIHQAVPFPASINNVNIVQIKDIGLFKAVSDQFPNNPKCYCINLLNKTINENDDIDLATPDSYPPEALTERFLSNLRLSHKIIGKALQKGIGLKLSMFEQSNNIRVSNDVCIIRHAIIDHNGKICGISKNESDYASCLEQLDCQGGSIHKSALSRLSEYAQHNTVAVLSEYWGEGFFHFFLEDLPRIVGILDMLNKNPTIKLHVTEINGLTKNILSTLGINPSRLISGVVLAENVIYPEQMKCGNPSYANVVALRDLFLKKMNENKIDYKQKQRKIITVINRSGAARSLTNHKELISALKSKYSSTGYEIVDYIPNHDKFGILHDLRIFRQSLAVIGPHGAGFSNIIACNPKTLILEIQTNDFNACFLSLAMKLDLQYAYFEDVLAHHRSNITADINCILSHLDKKLPQQKK